MKDDLYLEFLKRHNDVVAPILGGINPYYIGFRMFQDIEKKIWKKKNF